MKVSASSYEIIWIEAIYLIKKLMLFLLASGLSQIVFQAQIIAKTLP